MKKITVEKAIEILKEQRKRMFEDKFYRLNAKGELSASALAYVEALTAMIKDLIAYGKLVGFQTVLARRAISDMVGLHVRGDALGFQTKTDRLLGIY